MFIAFIQYPAIKKGKEAEFRQWFEWSNDRLAQYKGFVRRRLIEPIEGGNLAAILEFENRDAFTAFQKSPEHNESAKRVTPLLDGEPNPVFYEVIAG